MADGEMERRGPPAGVGFGRLSAKWWLSGEAEEDGKALRGPLQRALRQDELGFVQVDGEAPQSVRGIAISRDSRGLQRGQHLKVTVRLIQGLQ